MAKFQGLYSVKVATHRCKRAQHLSIRTLGMRFVGFHWLKSKLVQLKLQINREDLMLKLIVPTFKPACFRITEPGTVMKEQHVRDLESLHHMVQLCHLIYHLASP